MKKKISRIELRNLVGEENMAKIADSKYEIVKNVDIDVSESLLAINDKMTKPAILKAVGNILEQLNK